MGVTFDPLQTPRVSWQEFNPGNHGFPPFPFLRSNGVTNPAYGLKNYLLHSAPFSSTDGQNPLLSRMASGGMFNHLFFEYISPIFSFQSKPSTISILLGEAMKRGKKTRIGVRLYTFSYINSYKTSKKMPGKFLQLPGISSKGTSEGKT
jgi:hypothetical protein